MKKVKVRIEWHDEHPPGAAFTHAVEQLRAQLGVEHDEAMEGMLSHVCHTAILNDVSLSEIARYLNEAYNLLAIRVGGKRPPYMRKMN